MAKKLNEKQLQQIRNWLDRFPLNRSIASNKWHRDFSDGVIVATILKEVYPKLIDLHNYPASSSVQLKRNNWETLNNKVFKKLGMQQSSTVLDSVSKSIPGCIEQVLYALMKYETSERRKDWESQSQQDAASNENSLVVIVNKKIGDSIVQVPQKMILYSLYEQILRESREKDDEIAALNQKTVHLENMIALKNERIEELCGQLTKVAAAQPIKNEKCCSNTNSQNSSVDLDKELVPEQTTTYGV